MHDQTDRLSRQLQGIRLCLRGDRTLFLPETGSLLVADLHLGKSRHFRSRGLGVPEGADRDSAARLLRAAAELRPRELVVLGDLIHSAGALSPDLVRRLVGDLQERGVGGIVLIRGNHDRGSRSVAALEAAGITVLPALRHASGLELRHEPPSGEAGKGVPAGGGADGGTADAKPADASTGPDAPRVPAAPAAPYAAGHLHPVARISAPGERLRLPAFVIEEAGIILPAFGSFTGGAPVEAEPRRGRVAVWEGALIELDGEAAGDSP